MSAELKNLINLETLMFRQLEIASLRSKLSDEKKINDYKIEKILKDNDMNQHIAKLDENYEVKASLKHNTKKVFEKEKMADDLGVTVGATQKKDFLINKAEKGELTLEQFKRYFSWVPSIVLSVRKVKVKKPRKTKGI